MATISENLGKVLLTVTYVKNGREVNENCLVSTNYKRGINDRIPHKIKIDDETTLLGLIVLPNQPDKYLATLTREEYDSLYEYYIENKSGLEQEERERRLIKEQGENWFNYKNPKRCKTRNRDMKEEFRPFICYSNAFETNHHRH